MAIKFGLYREFPGSPVIKTLHFHCRGHGVQSLVSELRPHLLHAVRPKQNKTEQNKTKHHDLNLKKKKWSMGSTIAVTLNSREFREYLFQTMIVLPSNHNASYYWLSSLFPPVCISFCTGLCGYHCLGELLWNRAGYFIVSNNDSKHRPIAYSSKIN